MKTTISIDSSILHKHRTLKTEQIQLLNELSRLRLIDFYIPEMVLKEIKTQEINEISDRFDKILSLIESISKKSIENEELYFDEKKKYEKLKKQELVQIENKWKKFIKDNNIKLISLFKVRISKIIDDYFNGNPPFSTIKSRKDIPDSIIFHSLKELDKGNPSATYTS